MSRHPTTPALLTAATLLSHSQKSQALSLSHPAEKTFEQAQSAANLELSPSGSIQLYSRNLIEDDGPGIGYHQPGKNSAHAPTELPPGATLKKILHIPRPQASAAHLYLRPGPAVTLNGHPLTLDPATNTHQIPTSLLQQGDNEILLTNPAPKPLRIQTAGHSDIHKNAPDRAQNPPRSFLAETPSTPFQPLDGELLVRLHLNQFAPEGTLLSPIIDLATSQSNDPQNPLAPPLTLHALALTPQASTPPGTKITLAFRTGPTSIPDTQWTNWSPIPCDSFTPRPHRYLQYQATLSTTNPLLTPTLHTLNINAKISPEPAPTWFKQIHLTRHTNPDIRYTSIPFEYENPLHPKMIHLRKKYHLDDLVAGSSCELEKIVRLRNWIANQWKWNPPVVDYPDWDADEILTRKYGFCVQHAIAFLQCAISLGYQTRFLFGNNPSHGGHEVCEVWSNDYQKWIYIDPADNFHYVDRKTNIPLSMLETHDLVMKTYYPNFSLSYIHNPNDYLPVPSVGICYGLELAPTGSSPDFAKNKDVNGIYPLARMWTLIRYLSRNNFHEKPNPLPITQGRDFWQYADYIVWQGPDMPPGQHHFKNFTARRNDLEWTLNQTKVSATPTSAPGTLQIHLTTITPHLETFLKKIDTTPWQPTPPIFLWPLHPGQNHLELKTQTTSKIHGPPTTLELTYNV